MALTPVTNSSNVVAVGIDGSTVTVQYKSGTYDYFGVSDENIQRLRLLIAGEAAGSIGSFISVHIVRGHSFRKHEEARHGG